MGKQKKLFRNGYGGQAKVSKVNGKHTWNDGILEEWNNGIETENYF